MRALAIFIILSLNSFVYAQTEIKKQIINNLNFCSEQYLLMANSIPDSNVFPKTLDKNEKLITCKSGWWTSGFYPGSLWYLYEYSKIDSLKTEAIKRTSALEKEKNNKGTHDLGFMMFCSYGNGLRITRNPAYKDILIRSAKSLSTRYNSNTGCIKSWDGSKWQYPVIIDNMMNLELLFWATKETGDSSYYKIAVNHANKTMQNHFRSDFSSYHVINYDTITGNVIAKNTHQGYNDESAWSRGQAWGLYGFAMAYRETKYLPYLNQAKNIAKFVFTNKNLPSDLIPYWDFNAPQIPDAKRDVSAAAIICSAIIELSAYVDKKEKKQYLIYAEKILKNLSSANYMATKGENGNFILMHSVGALPFKSEVDVPLSYADYYFIEAMMRYLKLQTQSDK